MTETTQTGRLIPYLTEMFRLQAWMAMGKVASPVSGKVERDLPTARTMIDLLEELESRTEGHRSKDETTLLQGALTELRLNYVDEAKKPDPVEKPEETEASPSSGEEDPRPEPEKDKQSDHGSKQSETEPE